MALKPLRSIPHLSCKPYFVGIKSKMVNYIASQIELLFLKQFSNSVTKVITTIPATA